MHSRNAVLAVASGIVAAGLILGAASTTSGDNAKRETPFAGHYQGVADNGRVYLFDTTTGKCWVNGPDDKWKSVIPPIQASP